MINNENKNEIIEQFLLNKLSGELLDAVKHKLATDDKFRAAVALERSILRTIRTAGRADYRLKFESFHQEIAEESEVFATASEAEEQGTGGKVIKLNTRKYMLMAAASIALIIASTITLYTFLENNKTPTALYEAAYSPYPSLAVVRSAPAAPDVKAQAMRAYEAQNYTASINLFQQVLQRQKDESALFYLGNAYLAANKPEEAIATFKAYLSAYREFETEAKWYLSLSYLKTNNEKEAKVLLKELAATTTDEAREYREKAREMVKKLD